MYVTCSFLLQLLLFSGIVKDSATSCNIIARPFATKLYPIMRMHDDSCCMGAGTGANLDQTCSI